MATEIKYYLNVTSRGQCVQCRKRFSQDELVFGSARQFGESYGSIMNKHVKCVSTGLAKLFVADDLFADIDNWSQTEEAMREDFKNKMIDLASGKKIKAKGKRKCPSAARKRTKDRQDGKDKAKKRKKKDPNAPKRHLSGYMHFGAAYRSDLQSEYPEAKPKDIMKLLGDAWKNASEDEKAKFNNIAAKDKERYLKQLKEYEETGKFTLIEADAEDDTASDSSDSSNPSDSDSSDSDSSDSDTETVNDQKLSSEQNEQEQDIPRQESSEKNRSQLTNGEEEQEKDQEEDREEEQQQQEEGPMEVDDEQEQLEDLSNKDDPTVDTAVDVEDQMLVDSGEETSDL